MKEDKVKYIEAAATFRLDGVYHSIEVERDGRLGLWVDDGSGWHYVTADAFIEWAKAGGKVAKAELTEEQEALIDAGRAYKSVCTFYDIGGSVTAFIDKLQRRIRDLEAQLAEDGNKALHAEIERQRRDLTTKAARITDLEAQLAKTTPPKPKPPAKVRCIDCEHLDLATIRSGSIGGTVANCIGGGWDDGYSYGMLVYKERKTCHHFTPAAVGCGNADQALRAELARVTKEDKDA